MLLVSGWAREAGLEPGIDAHGNLWALPKGWSGPLVTSGSHVDTVPDGGLYDGALGTVLGLELAHEHRGRTTGGARTGVLVCAAEGSSAVQRRHCRLPADDRLAGGVRAGRPA